MFEVWRSQVLKVSSFIKTKILPSYFFWDYFFVENNFLKLVSPAVQIDLKVLQLKYFLMIFND